MQCVIGKFPLFGQNKIEKQIIILLRVMPFEMLPYNFEGV